MLLAMNGDWSARAMNLLVRINPALAVIFVLDALTTGLACRALRQGNAEREIVAQAGLMIDSALAASQAAHIEELVVSLGEEIDAAGDRRHFMKTCSHTKPAPR